MRDGRQVLLRQGALVALYVHSLTPARQLGCTRILLGSSRAFLHDGLTRYKGKWMHGFNQDDGHITANHVLDKMPGQTARIGFRISNADGSWSYSPQPLQIRDAQGHELWTHHPSRDVAAMTITAPEAFAKAAIPVNYLAADETFSKNNIGAGDEMIEYVQDRLGHDRRYSIDCSKARALGWAPARTLDEALAATVEWYRENRAWWEPLKG